MRRDPVLAFKLLRVGYSGAFESAAPVTSIRRAIHVLGRDKTLRWLSLSLESSGEHVNALPLMRAATLRGLFLEQLAGTVWASGEGNCRDELFVAGAFSLLDRITGAAIPRLLGPVVMGSQVTDAIVHRRGPYAPHLALIEAIERSDPMAMPAPCRRDGTADLRLQSGAAARVGDDAENRRRAATAGRGDGVPSAVLVMFCGVALMMII